MKNELIHYGILGMKWGIRRYQDSSGRLTKEGRERYKDFKKDVRTYNRAARKAGDEATIYGRAAQNLYNKSQKLNSKLEKNEDNERLRTKAVAAQRAYENIVDEYLMRKEAIEASVADMVKKYGSEHIKPIKYKGEIGTKDSKTGIKLMSEENIAKEAAIAGGLTAVVNTAFVLSGVPAVALVMPANRAGQLANDEYRKQYKAEKNRS